MLLKRRLITLSGCVQGVGFRPFIYRLAHQYQLVGNIRNTQAGVFIDVQGQNEAIDAFERDVIAKKPALATISEIAIEDSPLQNIQRFEIASSENQADTDLALLPDTAMCSLCFNELFDPKNRRYQYPFLHCVNCGPRFSLFLRMPFDRANTTMNAFSMCEECQREYDDPADRRFYSQTNCCPACGPKLQLFGAQGEPIDTTVEFLKQGKIAAVKNTGGYLLLADATNHAAVERLRFLKRRKYKPFALLLQDPSLIAEMSPSAQSVLHSPAAPIVFLKKLPEAEQWISPSVAPQSPYFGVMLPHNALQHLLLQRFGKPLVATSGNLSGKPLCITEEEAFKQLSGIADVFLTHNRQIAHRLDDSVVHMIDDRPMVIRRARGYIPSAFHVAENTSPLFGAGSHHKNSFSFAKKSRIYLSQYIGDLDSVDTCQAYDNTIEQWKNLLSIQSCSGVCDMHPDYYSSVYVQEREIKAEKIQHHVAHALSGMIDQKLSLPFSSIVWDGTGWGDDNTIWGGEAFIVEESGIKRFASLYPFALPGGEAAIREPRRSAYAIFGNDIPSHWFSPEELRLFTQMLEKKINSPICSSVGRLFDAVSALLDCCDVNDFEGQAALALEALASATKNTSIHYSISHHHSLIDWRPMIKQIWQDHLNGKAPGEIALAFHEALAECTLQLAQIARLPHVLLTGGVMQNKLLVEKAIQKLRNAGFIPHWHQHIPPNDGGLAVGQIAGSLYVPCIAR